MACKTDIPIIYKVQRVRDGKTFATRLIKGIQKEKVVFMCSYSFTKPEEGVTLEHQVKKKKIKMSKVRELMLTNDNLF